MPISIITWGYIWFTFFSFGSLLIRQLWILDEVETFFDGLMEYEINLETNIPSNLFEQCTNDFPVEIFVSISGWFLSCLFGWPDYWLFRLLIVTRIFMYSRTIFMTFEINFNSNTRQNHSTEFNYLSSQNYLRKNIFFC